MCSVLVGFFKFGFLDLPLISKLVHASFEGLLFVPDHFIFRQLQFKFAYFGPELFLDLFMVFEFSFHGFADEFRRLALAGLRALLAEQPLHVRFDA